MLGDRTKRRKHCLISLLYQTSGNNKSLQIKTFSPCHHEINYLNNIFEHSRVQLNSYIEQKCAKIYHKMRNWSKMLTRQFEIVPFVAQMYFFVNGFLPKHSKFEVRGQSQWQIKMVVIVTAYMSTWQHLQKCILKYCTQFLPFSLLAV